MNGFSRVFVFHLNNKYVVRENAYTYFISILYSRVVFSSFLYFVFSNVRFLCIYVPT